MLLAGAAAMCCWQARLARAASRCCCQVLLPSAAGKVPLAGAVGRCRWQVLLLVGAVCKCCCRRGWWQVLLLWAGAGRCCWQVLSAGAASRCGRPVLGAVSHGCACVQFCWRILSEVISFTAEHNVSQH